MVYYKSTDTYTHGHALCSLLQFGDMLVCVCVYLWETTDYTGKT